MDLLLFIGSVMLFGAICSANIPELLERLALILYARAHAVRAARAEYRRVKEAGFKTSYTEITDLSTADPAFSRYAIRTAVQEPPTVVRCK